MSLSLPVLIEPLRPSSVKTKEVGKGCKAGAKNQQETEEHPFFPDQSMGFPRQSNSNRQQSRNTCLSNTRPLCTRDFAPGSESCNRAATSFIGSPSISDNSRASRYRSGSNSIIGTTHRSSSRHASSSGSAFCGRSSGKGSVTLRVR